uniref:Magnetosome protein MamS/MamX domain-containing protein n=1 Tax=Desulfobacca acetoxidans TaxID=60893 RepID=A0A7V4G830_9BACT
MTKLRASILAALMLGSLMGPGASAWAQKGTRLHYSTLFNPGTIGTISGEVVRVEQVISGNGADYCVHAILATPRGQITAILAPKSYMQEKGLAIAPQDRVVITGSFLAISGKPFILAMELSGDRTMKLRRADGRPAWAVGEDWHVRPNPRKMSATVPAPAAAP